MITSEQVEKANDWIRDNANLFAQAKANRIYLEEFRKSKKALLFQEAKQGTDKARESYAYSHEDYVQLLEGLRAAVEAEESLRWKMVAAQARIELYRTQESTRRMGI